MVSYGSHGLSGLLQCDFARAPFLVSRFVWPSVSISEIAGAPLRMVRMARFFPSIFVPHKAFGSMWF